MEINNNKLNSHLCGAFCKLSIQLRSNCPNPDTQDSNTMNAVIQNFFGEMICQGRNAQRENLLHYVCHHNQYHLIEPFLAKRVRLSQLDIQGRTPVHVAIEKGQHECILVFQKLLKCYPKLNGDLQDDIRRTFQLYNNKGHTIIHEATLHNLGEVVQDMLQFCCNIDINLAYNDVLGCGDTLVHLIVRENLLEMAEIVCAVFPDFVNRSNYADILPLDLSCITQEMNEVLRKQLKLSKSKKNICKQRVKHMYSKCDAMQ